MKKLLILLVTLIALPLIAAVYGALHDQISFSVAPEYYTLFKYEQFQFDPKDFGGDRPTVAWIGVRATWWVGLFMAVCLGIMGLLHPDALSMRNAVVRGTVITLSAVLVCGLLGLAYGWFFITETPKGWYLPEHVTDAHRFLSAGSMHNGSYGGGLIGLVVALADMEWRRQRARFAAAAVNNRKRS